MEKDGARILPFNAGPDCSFTFREESRPSLTAMLYREAALAHARMREAATPKAMQEERERRDLFAAAMHRLVADDMELDGLAGAQSLKGRS